MIEVPKPIRDITGGNEASKCWNIWEDYVTEISSFVQEVSGVKDLRFFWEMEDLQIQNRKLALDGNSRVVTDDGLWVLLLDEWPIAQMMTFRDDANYHRITYSHIPEAEIKKISQGLRNKYQSVLRDGFEKYFNHNNS